ncbi:ferrous iron transport protein B [Candidatus Fermentibacterales bacterium]|nr:ferrous iron transport protein B [Candidatus Fermentibacterales bacterium]
MAASASSSVRVALAGNPNVGKTCIFNALTGARQHVGNYPGVTVDVATGSFGLGETRFEVFDLPGTYSLTPHSDDEREARRMLIRDRPDVVVNVIDATNLERNLYLTVQLLEMGLNTILALNMSDEAMELGTMPDSALLSQVLGVPVVETVGSRGKGADALKRAIAAAAAAPSPAQRISFGRDADEQIARIEALLETATGLPFPGRYAATKLLEGDEEIARTLEQAVSREDLTGLLEQAEMAGDYLHHLLGDAPEVLLAESRHGIASGAAAEATRNGRMGRRTAAPSLTQKIDNVVLNRFFGLPIFALAMYVTFWLTFGIGSPVMGLLERVFGWLGSAAASVLPHGPVESLIVDGIIGGVGGVLVFVPNIALLFLAISFMEDSGYMARAAFLVDGFMHRIGLHGRSFIPMLIGFGCTVPAVMATRVLDNRRDRLTTMMVLPLMSCGARLPIYLLVIGAFFPANRALVLWFVYVLGVLLAVGLAKLLRATILRGDNTPFVMELPPYRMPTARSIALHVWQRVRHYLLKAATVILAFSVILWFLSYYPRPPASAPEAPEHASASAISGSALGVFGRTIEPALKPLGFDWRIGTALVGALGAKEIFVAQMGMLFSLGGDESGELTDRLRESYDPVTGLGIILFALVMAPCIPTFVMVRRESRSTLWALGQFAGLTALAWVLVLAFNQVARLLT